MEIDGLSRTVQGALQSLSHPSQYLYPGPDESETGPLSRSLLLIGTKTNGSTYDEPGFHRTYRILEQTPNHHVEHFTHPETDYVQMTREHDVDPWALESRRSIFSFPIWVCHLSWPGAWVSMQQLLDQLKRYDQFEEAAPRIVLMVPDSFPFSEHAENEVDVILSKTELPRKPEDLKTLTKQLLQEHSVQQSVLRDDSEHGTGEADRVTSRQVLPLPPLQSNTPDRCWIGNITSFDQNHTLEKTTWPSFSYPSPTDTLRILEDIIDQSGVQCVELGQISPNNDVDDEVWQLEFLERFHSKWGNRPICYQLDNPRPDHPVWEYEHLLERYNHTSLQVHLGDANEPTIRRANSRQIENWLGHFLSCGGPKMKFSVDVDGTSESASHIHQICETLQSVNHKYIDGKAQLRMFLQPRLSDVSHWKTADELIDLTEQLQHEFENDLIQIKLDLPDQYDHMLQLIEV
jgi:hypothetical protein